MRSRFIAFLALAAATAAHAQTYKWVDERGVTNYSNTPPPARVAQTIIEDRVSVVPSEPVGNQTAALDRRLALQEAEWLQRQQLMALARVPMPVYDNYRMASYYPVSFVSFRAVPTRISVGARARRGSRR